MARRSTFWQQHGFTSRAAYRASRRAEGYRTYPLESQQRAAREGRGYGHGGDAFVRQFRDTDAVWVFFRNIVIKGWHYDRHRREWLQTRGADVPSRFQIFIDGDYAYRRMRRMRGGMKVYAAFLMSSHYGPRFSATDIKTVGVIDVRQTPS